MQTSSMNIPLNGYSLDPGKAVDREAKRNGRAVKNARRTKRNIRRKNRRMLNMYAQADWE